MNTSREQYCDKQISISCKQATARLSEKFTALKASQPSPSFRYTTEAKDFLIARNHATNLLKNQGLQKNRSR